MDVELGNKIAVMQRQLKEIQSCINGLQSIAINGNDAMRREITDLRKQQDIILLRLDKLSGDVKLVNAEGKLKTSYKDYSSAEIYAMHTKQGLSWNRIASLIGCSVSTVRRKYKEYLYNDMEVDF
jgi:DNA invertase Pin-like site-specific DNA recombinase